MSRQFPYYVEPDEVRQYLNELGCQTEDIYNREQDKVVGFLVCDTSVIVGYDLVSSGRIVAQREIAFKNDPYWTGGDSEKEERSLKLYQKLYRRFHKRRSS